MERDERALGGCTAYGDFRASQLKVLCYETQSGRHIPQPDAYNCSREAVDGSRSRCPLHSRAVPPLDRVSDLHTHIASLRRNAGRIASAGIHEVLFFHSSQQDVKSFHQDLPFDAVADPGKRYYRELGVEQSWAYAMHPRALWAALKGMGSGFNLAMTGGPTGLPAEFLIAADGLIKAVKYGRHAFDQWSVEELLELAKQSSSGPSSEPLMDGAITRR